MLWTKDSLPELLEFVGFRVVLHEYYDRKGKFHMNKNMSVEEIPRWGFVERSFRFMRYKQDLKLVMLMLTRHCLLPFPAPFCCCCLFRRAFFTADPHARELSS